MNHRVRLSLQNVSVGCERFPVVIGTIVGQTLLNLVALLFAWFGNCFNLRPFTQKSGLILTIVGPIIVILSLSLLAPFLLRTSRQKRSDKETHPLRRKLVYVLQQVREGIRVLARPRVAIVATVLQLAAWGLQLASCYVLIHAIGVHTRADWACCCRCSLRCQRDGCVAGNTIKRWCFSVCMHDCFGSLVLAMLTRLRTVLFLQAVELVTAVILGMPALFGEGLSWREVRATHFTLRR